MAIPITLFAISFFVKNFSPRPLWIICFLGGFIFSYHNAGAKVTKYTKRA